MIKRNMFGDDAVFDHIGLAVKSLQEALCEKTKIFCDETQKVLIAFVRLNGIKVELLEPIDEHSPVCSSLKKACPLVHLCFRVPDLRAAIQKGRENGFHCISKPVAAKAFKGKKIIWIYSRTYGLVELVEDTGSPA